MPAGFTLLELLMVVIIVGLLASIATHTYLKVILRMRTTEAITTLAAIRKSQIQYKSQYNTYSLSMNGLTVNPPTTGTWIYLPWVLLNDNAWALRSGSFDYIAIDLDNGDFCTNDVTTYYWMKLSPC